MGRVGGLCQLCDLGALRGVSNVHDLHVWAYGAASRVALSVHLVADLEVPDLDEPEYAPDGRETRTLALVNMD